MTEDATVVLVVEDDRNIVDLVQSNLLVRGFSVVVSRTGTDVAALVDQHRPGAGLGLAIARGIVDAHGGTIRLEPSARGTTVAVTLPIEPVTADA